MPTHPISDDAETFYICGQCKTEIHYLVSENPPVPCPDCGWIHKSKRQDDVPSEIKISLGQY